MTRRSHEQARPADASGAPIALPAAWRARAAERRAEANENAARCYERCAAELEAALAVDGDALLSLTEAAAETGLSADHLGRLVRTGRIPNAGRPNAPKLRRRDLPAPRPEHAGLRSAPVDATLPPARAQIAEAVVTLHKAG